MSDFNKVKITSDSGITVLSENGIKVIDKKETLIEPGFRITCKECGFKFFIGESNKKWYEENNMVMPKKCWHCRKKNKERNAKVENGGA